MSLSNPLAGLRQPEYTGENRCLPCTVVNLGIAVALAVAAATLLGVAGVSWPVSALVGGLIFATAVGLIYLRGYLVPGTPTLTKRHMPLWLLDLFGKAPEPARDDGGNVDVEAILLEADVLEPCADRDDLCLTESFEAAWHDRITDIAVGDSSTATTAGDPGATADGGQTVIDPGIDDFVAADDLEAGIDLDAVQFEEWGDAYVAMLEDRRLAQWESRAAYVADVAAAGELRRRYPGWRTLTFPERTEVAGSLRLWLERCPDCSEPVAMNQETVESCCYERQVLAAACDGCGARLFEADLPQDMVEAD